MTKLNNAPQSEIAPLLGDMLSLALIGLASAGSVQLAGRRVVMSRSRCDPGDQCLIPGLHCMWTGPGDSFLLSRRG